VRGFLSLILLCSVCVSVCDAQQSTVDSQQHATSEMQNMPGMDHDVQNMRGMDMGHTSMSWRPSWHEGSGTVWEQASAPLLTRGINSSQRHRTASHLGAHHVG
jgi:uncharacterized protein involved in copper resistance